jgi:AcrR family transcriptional regulator
MSTEPVTRDRILEAAKQEFAAEGLAGGRVDAIARLAGCNKQLIYHYFGDKNGLFDAVMSSVLSDKPPFAATSRAEFAEHLVHVFEDGPKRRPWLRLLMWEALAYEDRPLVAEETRRGFACRGAEDMERAQATGMIDPALPPRMVLLAMMALAVFPWVLPQMTRLVTGHAPSDPLFKRQYGQVLRAIARRLGGCPAGGTKDDGV